MTNVVGNIPGKVDIRHRQGSVQLIPLEFKKSDGSPEDISGRDYVLSVRRSATSAVLVTYSTTNGAIVLTDAVNGLATITIDDVATPLVFGDFLHDFDEVVGAVSTPIAVGNFEIFGDR